MVVLFPGLRLLDSYAVTEEERAAAPRLVEQEQALMAVMLSSACTVHKMVRA